mgnify:CR=1 FL=1
MTELNVNSTFDKVDTIIGLIGNDWGLMTEDMQKLHYRYENSVDRLRSELMDEITDERVKTLNIHLSQLEKLYEIVKNIKVTNKMFSELEESNHNDLGWWS